MQVFTGRRALARAIHAFLSEMATHDSLHMVAYVHIVKFKYYRPTATRSQKWLVVLQAAQLGRPVCYCCSAAATKRANAAVLVSLAKV